MIGYTTLFPNSESELICYFATRNGWYDPLIQYQAYYNFTVWPGNTYDYSPFNARYVTVMAKEFKISFGIMSGRWLIGKWDNC
jgi:hypothetical protein